VAVATLRVLCGLAFPGVQEISNGGGAVAEGGGRDDCALCVVCTVQYYVNVHYASCTLHTHIVWIASFAKSNTVKNEKKIFQ
jgi:hypothetical protein